MKKWIVLIILLFSMNIYGADIYVTDMTEDTSPTSDDIIYVINDPSGTPVDRKVTLGNAITKGHGLSGENYILYLNASAVMGATNTLNVSAVNLPSSDANPGTTAGQIKHDSSDTGVSGGGAVKWYDGTNVRTVVDIGTTSTYITETEFIPIAWMIDGVAGSEPDAIETIGATTERKIKCRTFAGATTNDNVEFNWWIPIGWAGQGAGSNEIKIRPIWVMEAAGAANVVSFDFTACSASGLQTAHDDINCGAGTLVTSNTTLDATEADDDIVFGTWASLILTNGAAQEMAMISMTRDATDTDTYAQDICVVGVEIKYVKRLTGIGGY